MINLPGVQPEQHRDDLGRPTDYRPEYDAQAKKLCEFGATDDQLAEFFGVTRRTIANWRIANESFAVACRIGKQHTDEEVKRSALMVARGFTYTEQQAIKVKEPGGGERVEIVEVERVQPPNAMMQAKWLAVRGDKEFAETQRIEHSGEVKQGLDITSMTVLQREAYRKFLEAMQDEESDSTAPHSTDEGKG